MYRIAVVCTGNICRSPMAEFALRREIERAGLADVVAVDSGGVSDEEHGRPVDPRARAVLQRQGLDSSGHAARQVTAGWFDHHDLLLAMEARHARHLERLAPTEADRGRVRLYRSFDPRAAELAEDRQGVADPWYGAADGFDTTWDMVDGALAGIVDFAREQAAAARCPGPRAAAPERAEAEG